VELWVCDLNGCCSTITAGQFGREDKWSQAEQASHRWWNNSSNEGFLMVITLLQTWLLISMPVIPFLTTSYVEEF